MDVLIFKLVVAYEGTNYSGWQTQKTGVGVQQVIEAAVKKIFPGAGPLCSSSRTDTGVHAVGMVAHVDIPRIQFRMVPEKLALALNALLPPDIRIVEAGSVSDDFHARFDATGKEYRYFVWNHSTMNPLLRLQAWHVPRKLNLAAMKSAAKHFLGRHDFRSFAANRNYETENTVRRLRRCDLKRSGDLITFTIVGDGFLYKMCRGIVGTLVQIGEGKIGQNEIRKILACKDRRAAGMTAPAHGLVLQQVFYGPREPGQRRKKIR